MFEHRATGFRNSSRVILSAVIVVAGLQLETAAKTEESTPKPPAAASTAANLPGRGDYRIGPDDVLDISVWNNTAISRTVPVRPDGMITLPLLNDIQASGLTPMELRDILTRKLAAYMQSPEVSVIVREVHSCKVTVMGEVKKPGRYEIGTRATVLDAIAQAGGFTDFASRGMVTILRNEGRTLMRLSIRYKDAVAGRADDSRFSLRPGDTVVVR